MRCDRWKQCTPGGQLHSPHEIKLPSRKTAAKNVIGDRFSRWLQQQRWAIALHLTHSCCSCKDNHQSGPAASFEWKHTAWTQIYITALRSQMCSNRSFFEGRYSNKSRWERERVKPPSAGERGSVCMHAHVYIQVCECQQEGFKLKYCPLL